MRLGGKAYCLFFLLTLLSATALTMTVKEVHAFLTVRALLDERGIWLQEKTSKAMLLARREEPPDIVFIGSSRVQFNVDTSLFREKGINAFNYGVSGRYWEDYPYAMNRAVESGAKVIVLSIAPVEINQPIPCPQEPTLDDLITHARFRGVFNKCFFGSWNNYLSVFYSNRYKKHLDETNQTRTAVNLGYLQSLYNTTFDINKVSHIYGSSKKLLVVLTNGDGIMYSSLPISGSVHRKIINPPTEESVSYLEALAKPALEAEAKVILLLEPLAFKYRFSGGENIDVRKVGIGIIDASNMVFDKTKWGDVNHFNAEGRKLYTQQLIKVLAPLFR